MDGKLPEPPEPPEENVETDDKRNSDDFGDNANDDGVSIKRQNKKFSKLRKIFNIRKSKKL
ncbi:12961_t:CDS:2 [Entrophospora sp. SA101]|nr:12961_t:CDS:2 [Entrophospora sp. SA101]